jgi:hypothetical protein
MLVMMTRNIPATSAVALFHKAAERGFVDTVHDIGSHREPQ